VGVDPEGVRLFDPIRRGSSRWLARSCAVLVGAVSIAGIAPAVSAASTIIGSPLSEVFEGSIGHANAIFVQTALPEASARLTSPVDGTIVRWSLRGTSTNGEPNTFTLRVLRPAGSGTFLGAGTSAQETTPNGFNDSELRQFTTLLPIRAGDHIGLATVGGADVPVAMVTGASNEFFEPFPDGSSSGSPEVLTILQERELLFNAEVVAAPTSSATIPPCSEDGKVAVHVTTDPATTPKAVDFRIDAGATQLVAASGAVASAITVPGGKHTLEYWAEDEVPQQELVHHSATLQVGGCTPGASAPGTTTPGVVAGQPSAPVIGSASQTHTTWREGHALATFSRTHKAALGTMFSFTLNEQASVSFAFTQQVGGRKVKGKCVAQTKKDDKKPSCKRTVTQGTLSLTGHSGTDKVFFQGRISASKKLPLGRYRLVITATNSAGQRSQPQSLSFTIVK
jgi:hypothetical protein